MPPLLDLNQAKAETESGGKPAFLTVETTLLEWSSSKKNTL
jgi:hypothetical protein